MKLDDLFYFARTNDIRAVAKGQEGRTPIYYCVVDTITPKISEEIGRFESENDISLRMLPFHEYSNQGKEIWREAKLSPINIREEVIAFAKKHPPIQEVTFGVHDEEGFDTWYFIMTAKNYRAHFFDIAPKTADFTRQITRRGTHIDVCLWPKESKQAFLGKRIWKRA